MCIRDRLNTDDRDVVDRLKIFTFFTRAEIEEFAAKVENEPFKREAQRALALAVCSIVHGEAAATAAEAASQALFGRGELRALDADTLRSAITELPHVEAKLGDDIAQLLVATGAVDSLSEARRAIKQGGVSLNNEKVDSDQRVLEAGDLLPGNTVVLRRGKKTLVGAIVD